MKSDEPLLDPRLVEENLSTSGLLEQVYGVIRSALVSGEFEPGQWLRQRQLAHELGVSQTTVRHALNQLAAESLIVIEPRRGFRTAIPTPEYMQDLGDVLISLEHVAVELAIPRLTRGKIDRMWELVPVLINEAGRPMEELMAADREFHTTIVQAAGRPHLLRLFSQTYDMYHSFPFLHYSEEELALCAENIGQYYPAIVTALETGDPVSAAEACTGCWESDMDLDRQAYARLSEQGPVWGGGE
jgi:DNA-binding GntR family transcriptional regulator